MIAIVVTTFALALAAFIIIREVRATSANAALPEPVSLHMPESATPGIVNAAKIVLGVAIVGYLLFDRAFAWLHVPGVPLFLGEAVLALGIATLLVSPLAGFGSVLRRNPTALILGAWMLWGATFLALQGPRYGIDALRDAAQWYYASFAFVVLFLMNRGYLTADGVRKFLGKIAPFVIVWMPLSILVDTLTPAGPPYVPDSLIQIFAHRPGNAAVVSMAFVGYLWLVDDRRSITPRIRMVLTTIGILTVLFAGIVNRGGLVAGALGLALVLIAVGKQRGSIVLTVSAVVVGALSVAVVTNLEVDIFNNGRVISARQFLGNIASVTDLEGEGGVEAGTISWRLRIWELVMDDITNLHPVTGFGPGPDLGERYGITTNPDVPLRNPHNSHLGVLARMGWVGAALWSAFWVSWYVRSIRASRAAREYGAAVDGALLSWLGAVAAMVLVNAIFDPTLEGPQVAIPLWSAVGLGLYLTDRYLQPVASSARIDGDLANRPPSIPSISD